MSQQETELRELNQLVIDIRPKLEKINELIFKLANSGDHKYIDVQKAISPLVPAAGKFWGYNHNISTINMRLDEFYEQLESTNNRSI